MHLDLFPTKGDIHEYQTRNKLDLSAPQYRLSKSIKSYKYNCFTYFIRLPETIRTLPLSKLKHVSEWLVTHPYYSLSEFLDDNLSLLLVKGS